MTETVLVSQDSETVAILSLRLERADASVRAKKELAAGEVAKGVVELSFGGGSLFTPSSTSTYYRACSVRLWCPTPILWEFNLLTVPINSLYSRN